MSRDTVIADFHKTPGGFRVRLYVVVGIFLFLIASLLIAAAWPIITIMAVYVVVTIAVVCAVAALVGLCAFFFTVLHWMRRENAKTRKIEREANLMTHPQNMVAWQWQGRQLVPIYEPRQAQAALLPSRTDDIAWPASFDFLTVMTQPKRVYSIVADQQTGKTTLCHYIVEYWMDRGIKPVVIGQKFDAGEYFNCERYGPAAPDILAGFEVIRQEAEYRQQLADEGQPFGEMDLQPVFLEDFTSFGSVMDRGELGRFVSQALTVYAARGLLLYFVAHSRTKDAFGLMGQGAALKNQMTRLEIIAAYFADGQVDHSRKRIVCSIGNDMEPAPVVGVPGYKPNLNQDCKLSLYSDGATFSIPPEHDTVLRMYANEENTTAIGAEISKNGHKGGKQNKRVKRILAEYGIEA